MAYIETTRLTGKPLSDKDQAACVEILTDTTVAQTYMVPDFASEEEAVRIFRRLQTLSLSDKHYVVGLYLDEVLIGWISKVEQEDHAIELGYVLHPRYHSQGYMTEALQAVIADLFSRGYDEVVAGAFEENGASIRVMEKCGMMKLERQEEIEYHGKVHRCVYYSILHENLGIRE